MEDKNIFGPQDLQSKNFNISDNEKNEEKLVDICNTHKPIVFSHRNTINSSDSAHQSENNHTFKENKFNHDIIGNTSLLLRPNKLTDSSSELKTFSEAKNVPEKEQYIKSNNYLKKKIRMNDNTSIPYDSDFKKPHFLRYSVFDDDIAAFKDESSPNLLSTAASSLSSLTIDDDDYNDNQKPNKAGLVKLKSNVINLPQVQKLDVQEQWSDDPSEDILLKTKQIVGNGVKKFLSNASEKQDISDPKFKTHSLTDICECQRNQKNKIGSADFNEKMSSFNPVAYQHMINSHSIRSEAEGSTEEIINKSNYIIKDRPKNMYQENEKYANSYIKEFDIINANKYDRSSKCDKHREQRLFKENSYSCEFIRNNNEINQVIDESNELNAYEEQLLDQCIRRGMAKVTKKDIKDIKPFCWDLNKICLTTRAILKYHDDNIRERQEEYNKQCILQRGLSRHMAN